MPSGHIVSEKEAQMVVNVAGEIASQLRKAARRGKSKLYPRGTITQTAQLTHLSREKVAAILKTYKITGTVPRVSTKRNKRRFAKVEEQMHVNLRNTINSFLERNEAPTVSKIHRALTAINEIKQDTTESAKTSSTQTPSTSAAADEAAEKSTNSAWKVGRTTTYYLMKELGYTYAKKRSRNHQNIKMSIPERVELSSEIVPN